MNGRGTAGSLITLALFAGLNYKEWFREARCADCRYLHGIPFAFYREDAFYGGEGIVWAGLFGDVVVGLALMALAGWLSEWIWRKLAAPTE